MVDILFGQSYFLRFDPKLWEAMQPFPPLGTLYAASLMRQKGYSVALFDAMLADSEDQWAAALDQRQPSFAVIFEDNFNYLSKMCLGRMRQAAITMIGMARQRGCTVILCGADATDHPDIYLSAGADFVLLGEGELTLVELLDRLSGKSTQPFDDILGLAWKSQSKPLPVRQSTPLPVTPTGLETATVQSTPRRPDIQDLDILPFPAWDLVEIPLYKRIWTQRHGYFAMNMVTTRGCPFHCNWCAKPIWGQRYNVRSPENVAKELVWLVETYQPDFISFVDDIFGLKPGWMKRFAEAVSDAGVRIPFKCLSRVDLLARPGEVDALKSAGCALVWVGAESGSQNILDAMEKGTRVIQIVRAAQSLHQVGIQVGFFLQFGYPGETLQDISRTIQMVLDCQPDDIGISVSYPLPGTKFFNAVKAELGAKQNWHDSNDLAMLYQGPFSTQFYRQLHKVVHTEFRLRKAWKRLSGKSQTARWVRWRGRENFKESWLGSALRLLVYALRLPWQRWELNLLAKTPHKGLGFLPVQLSPEQSAIPTPQEE